MSVINTFDITIQSDDDRTKTIAAVIIERALERDGFVNVQIVDARENNKLSMLSLMREIEPQLFEKHVVVQEITTMTSNRFYEVDKDYTPQDTIELQDLELV